VYPEKAKKGEQAKLSVDMRRNKAATRVRQLGVRCGLELRMIRWNSRLLGSLQLEMRPRRGKRR
jgi:hypothetical protein